VSVAAHGGPPVVVGFAAGARGRQLEAMSDDQAVATALAALGRATGRSDVPAPQASLVTRWGSDPFARCSYSNVVVGSSFDDYDTLAEPAGRLHFAGEATESRYPSTAHGAYLSGRRAAREIAAA
jgi:polyamine oxidase